MAAQIFNTKSISDEQVQVTQKTMCPTIQESCCDEDTFKNMNVWWEGTSDDPMSMSRLWSEKIRRIWQEMKLMQQVYFPKIQEFIKSFDKFKEPNIQCENMVDFVAKADKIGAFDQLFYVFPQTAEKCWQFTVDWIRGLACSICDTQSTYFYSTKGFILDNTQCYKYADSCSFHMHSYRTFFEYSRWLSAIASCKAKNQIMPDEDVIYFSNEYTNKLNNCMKDSKTNYCLELCQDEMPWNGATKKELDIFTQHLKFLNNIKAIFPDEKWTKNSDSIVDTWVTNKDNDLKELFNTATFRQDAFNITDYWSTQSAINLLRLGFKDVHDFANDQNSISYFASIASIGTLALLMIHSMM